MKHRRKKYLVNTQYQVGASLLTLAVVLVIVLISILLTHYYTLSMLINRTHDTGRPLAAEELIGLSFRPMIIVIPLVIIMFVFVALFLIFISHRTAGPLFNLKRAMSKVAEGDLAVRVKFRKNDEIHDMEESFNDMVESLQKKYEKK